MSNINTTIVSDNDISTFDGDVVKKCLLEKGDISVSERNLILTKWISDVQLEVSNEIIEVSHTDSGILITYCQRVLDGLPNKSVYSLAEALWINKDVFISYYIKSNSEGCMHAKCNTIYEIYMALVESLTRYVRQYSNIEGYTTAAFSDLSVYLGDKWYDPMYLNFTMKGINNALSMYSDNMEWFNDMISDRWSKTTTHCTLKAADDIIDSTDTTVYYCNIDQPIGMSRKAHRCIVLIDLSEEYHIISLGFTLTDALLTEAEIPDLQFLYTIDLDSENASEQYDNFVKDIFSYYSKFFKLPETDKSTQE